MSQRRMWILYDERARGGCTDDAAVLVACDSKREARRFVRDWPRCAVYRYDVLKFEDTNELVNETRCIELEPP
jgi:hypothetical protein